MEQNLQVLIVVSISEQQSKDLGELVRLSGIEDIHVRCFAPKKGLATFIDVLMSSRFYNPTILLTADVFSNCEVKPPIHQVVEVLLMNKRLDIRKIFVVGTHAMGTIDSDEIIVAGAHGVYNVIEIDGRDFQKWIKGVWNKATTSTFKNLSDGVEGTTPKQTIPPAGAKETQPQPSPRTPPATPPSPSSLVANNTNQPANEVVKSTGEKKPSADRKPIPKESLNPHSAPTDQQSKIPQPLLTGELQTMLSDENQKVLLLALAAASKAFGESLERQLSVNQKIPETQTQTGTSDPKKHDAKTPPGVVVLQTINGRRTRLMYNNWDLDLPRERAELFRLFIESKGKMITFESVRIMFRLNSKARDFSARQKIDIFIAGLEELIPGITKQFEIAKWEGCIFTLPE